jgi:hypothetical protein
VQPFDDWLNNMINVYNELVIIITFISVLMMNTMNLPEQITNLWGWILVILILLPLLSVWIITIPGIISMLCKCFKALKSPKKAPKNNIKASSCALAITLPVKDYDKLATFRKD